MSHIYNFLSEKKKTMAELESVKSKGVVDNKVLPILEIINSNPDYYSTSSCSGRVMLIALARPGAKSESDMLALWHDKITKKELLSAIKKWDKHQYLYFLAQPPIFHITTHNIDYAIHLRNLAESVGLKYSTIRSIKTFKKQKEQRIIVELLGTERLNVPIGFDGKVYVDENYLELLVKLASDVLADSDEKIKKLDEELRNKL
jgi:tRNA wybutosine-synthesizing protein 3